MSLVTIAAMSSECLHVSKPRGISFECFKFFRFVLLGMSHDHLETMIRPALCSRYTLAISAR